MVWTAFTALSRWRHGFEPRWGCSRLPWSAAIWSAPGPLASCLCQHPDHGQGGVVPDSVTTNTMSSIRPSLNQERIRASSWRRSSQSPTGSARRTPATAAPAGRRVLTMPPMVCTSPAGGRLPADGVAQRGDRQLVGERRPSRTTNSVRCATARSSMCGGKSSAVSGRTARIRPVGLDGVGVVQVVPGVGELVAQAERAVAAEPPVERRGPPAGGTRGCPARCTRW